MEARNLVTALHQEAAKELLKLMDGLYFNIEDGLFELACRVDCDDQRSRCFDLMREMRYRKPQLILTFSKKIHKYQKLWFKNQKLDMLSAEEEIISRQTADKAGSHFSGLLATISDRVNLALGSTFDAHCLPIGPYYVSRAFVGSCSTLNFDGTSIRLVQDLFSRFVLDRLGGLYAKANDRLEAAGLYTSDELNMATLA